jgi:hypothetical protein
MAGIGKVLCAAASGLVVTVTPFLLLAHAAELKVDAGVLQVWTMDAPPLVPEYSVCGSVDDYAGILEAEPGVELVAPPEPAGESRGWILVGTSGSDTLTGGNHDDCLVGGGGNDVLQGLEGRDVLVGGAGNDALSGGNGIDRLLGGEGDDHLDGGRGRDSMDAGEGNDVCVSEGGPDDLVGCETTQGGEGPGHAHQAGTSQTDDNSLDPGGTDATGGNGAPPASQLVPQSPPADDPPADSPPADDPPASDSPGEPEMPSA